MLIGLSKRRPERREEAEDAVDMLLACHERIRSFTLLALRLAAGRHEPPGEIADVAARVHRYFTVALPIHEADEDRSLRPRLEAASLDRAVVEAALAMSEEHIGIDAEVANLERACERLAREPQAIEEVGPTLERSARRLGELFASHLDLEERTIFPAIRTALPVEEQRALAAEMRARRGLAGAAER
jgi:hemerythrin-like domain-containing protein